MVDVEGRHADVLLVAPSPAPRGLEIHLGYAAPRHLSVQIRHQVKVPMEVEEGALYILFYLSVEHLVGGFEIDPEEHLSLPELICVLEGFHFSGIEEVEFVESILAEGHLVLFVLQLGWLETVVKGVLDSDVNSLLCIVVAHVLQVEDRLVDFYGLGPFLEQSQVIVEIVKAPNFVIHVFRQFLLAHKVNQAQLVHFVWNLMISANELYAEKQLSDSFH